MKFHVKALCALTLSFCLNFGAQAQYGGGSSQPTPYSYGNLHAQYYKSGVDATAVMLGQDLLGDAIDPLTGRLSVSHTDISIPGNSSIPVSLSRSTGSVERHFGGAAVLMGDWTPNFAFVRARIPESQSWRTDRCTGAPHNVGQGNSVPLWQGMSIFTPGAGMRPVLNKVSGNWGDSSVKYVTKDYWRISCINSIPTGGQGFKATSPDGMIYHFTAFRSGRDRQFPQNRFSIHAPNIWTTHVLLYASKIEDPNGNWVQFDYTDSSKAGPTRIWSNDGREITLNYSSNGKLITSATANGRTWSYTYGTGNFGTKLTKVTLPDGRHWDFNNLDWLTLVHDDPSNDAHCLFMQWDHVQSSIKHPDGTIGTYNANFEIIDLGEGVPVTTGYGGGNPVDISHLNACEGNPNGYQTGLPQGTFAGSMPSRSVNRRELTVPGGSNYVWTYDYPDIGAENHHATEGYLYYNAPLLRRSKVDPNGVRTDTYLINEWGWGHGALYKTITYASASGGTPLQTTYTVHGTYLWQVGGAMHTFNVHSVKTERPIAVEKQIIVRGSDTYTTDYQYNHDINSSGWSAEKPTTTTTYSSIQSGSRTAVTAYETKRTPWIVALPKTVHHNGKLIDGTTYDSKGRPTVLQKFGSTYATVTYNGDGTVSSVKDALNRTLSLSSYKRGQARNITLPDTNTLSRVIDDDGRITSETNARGYTTGYQYDTAGRVTRVDRPGSWADTIISYGNIGNGLTQTSTRGNSRTVTTYDGFIRPTLVKAEDLTGHSAARFTKTEYDFENRVTFASWPSTSANPTTGVDTTYDALGRTTQVRENVTPFATTSTAYLAGNQVRVTDPSGAQTTTSYRAYGGPDMNEPMVIVDATGTTTTMTRDIWGNITNLNQSSGLNGYTVNVDRKFWYDNRFRLCRHRAPEFGDELFAYDNANQLTISSRGEPAGSSCGTPTAARRTAFSYDAMGRQTLINFPSGTADIVKTYDENGNIKTNKRDGINWYYTYNELDLLTKEQVYLDNRGYIIDHGYNSTGHLLSRGVATQPTFNFAPNGFGEPTVLSNGASNFVSSISYHANGAVNSANYSNGRNYTQTLTNRQLPYDIKVQGTGGTLVSLRHGYDARGKISSITDYVVSGQNRTFVYDARGRVTNAAGSWGNIVYKYDGLDNFRAKYMSGGISIDASYPGNSNLVDQVYDSRHGVTQNYTYDSLGNITSNGKINLTYDWASQPVAMVGSGISNTYKYDGNLKRIKTVQNGKTTYWIYSALTGTPIYSDETTDVNKTNYYSAGGAQFRLTNGNPKWTHLDHQGTPIAATWWNGNFAWREHYTPFGEKTTSTTHNDNDIGYTGHVMDDASGLTYMQARYYDPVIGRFLSTDPIGYQDQLNLYAYVHNDPVNMIDPTGMMSWKKFGAAFGRAGGRLKYAGGAAMVDSPAPGPGDAAAVVIGAATAVAFIWDVGDAILSPSDNQNESLAGVAPLAGETYGDFTDRLRKELEEGFMDKQVEDYNNGLRDGLSAEEMGRDAEEKLNEILDKIDEDQYWEENGDRKEED